jgi:DNA-binding MarR family transcriptional regulator
VDEEDVVRIWELIGQIRAQALRRLHGMKHELPGDLSLREVGLLLRLPAEGLTLTQLAQREGISPSTLTGMVDRLEERGLVQRERHGEDRRMVWVKPTALTQSHLNAWRRILEATLGEALKAMPVESRRALRAGLEAMVRILTNGEMNT